MSISFKKRWTVRADSQKVCESIRRLPEVFADGVRAGILMRMGGAYLHQRKDIKPKAPVLAVEKPGRLVFRHDAIPAFTYTVEVVDRAEDCEVVLEVKSAGPARDASAAEQVVAIIFTLAKTAED